MTLNLTTRYRNLLIALSREHRKVEGVISRYREIAEQADSRTRIGLLTKAKAIERLNRSAHFLITRNGAAMRHFFKTENLEAIAQEKIQ